MNSRAVKLAVSLLLTVSLLCCFVSVFAVDPSPSPSIPPLDEGTGAVTDELMSRYIWMCLNAWGIQIKYEDMDEFYDEVENQIITWVIEYLASLPSSYTINQWIAPWQGDFDYWGNLRLNSSALEDIQDFAQWLGLTYGLSDNSNIVVNPVQTLGGYQLYEFNKFYSGNWIYPFYSDQELYYNYVAMQIGDTTDTDLLGWFQACITDYPYNTTENGFTWWIYVIGTKEISGTKKLVWKALSADDVSITRATSQTPASRFTIGDNISWEEYDSYQLRYYYNEDDYWGNYFVIDGNHLRGTESYVYQFLNSATVEQEGDLQIITGIIDFPVDNPNYTDGDSITIIDGQPDYSVIEWDGTVTVDNLPAIVSTGTIENPEIDQIYTNIPAFFQMAGDTMNGFKQILFRMPDEVLIAIYAVLAVGVIFGFLRIMREH